MPASPGGYVETIEAGKNGRVHWLEPDDLVFEFMLNALRLQEGFELNLFEQMTGLHREAIQFKLDELSKQGLLDIKQDHLRLSDKGRVYLNDVVGAFLTSNV